MFPELELKEGWITVICLLMISLCVAWAIQAAKWAEGLAVIQGMALVGALLGIVLAKSRFPNRSAHLLSVLAGATWALYLTSRALAEQAGFTWQSGVLELEARLQQMFNIAFSQGSSADNYVFVVLLAFLIWIMAYFSAWAVFRWQQVWWAVIVCGASLILNINYSSADLTIYLLLFLLFSLLLVVRSNIAFRVQEWRKAQVGYNPDLVSTFVQTGLMVSIVVILLAWAAPGALASRPLQPVWDKLGEPWRRLQDRSARLFRDLNYQNQPPLASLGDRRMWFGGPVNLTDTPIADIKSQYGRYWRVMVFHDYIGNGWLSNDPDTVLLEDSERTLAFPELELRYEMTHTVTLFHDWGPSDALIVAGQPLQVGLPLRASVSMVTNEEDMIRARDGTIFPPAPGDPSVLYSRQSLANGESYQALSSLTRADKESLREASTGYPNWVAPRYLQLPEDLPQRVRILAAEITAGSQNPYDRAEAIESYLRQIPYNLEISGPRTGQDGVDYFLFDAKQGYCDYYASAMVVMLRAVGVPARYVRGYINPQNDEGTYHILESDGHAWPEVYFPGYGWIEFEPTGGRPALVRANTQSASTPGTGLEQERQPLPRSTPILDDELQEPVGGGGGAGRVRFSWDSARHWSVFALLFVTFGTTAFALFRVRRQRQTEHLSVIERAYADLVFWMRRLLRVEPLVHQTPHEYAGLVVQNVPRGQGPVEQIVNLYVEERFGGKQVPPESAATAWDETWQALRARWIEKRLGVVRRFWWKFVPPKDMEMSD